MSQEFKVLRQIKQISVAQSFVGFNTVGSSVTLGSSQSGEFILLTATGGSAISLPAPFLGLDYKFIVKATGANTITAPTASIIGSVVSAVSATSGISILTTGAAKTVLSTTAGSAIGDAFRLVADGTNYYVSGSVAAVNALKFA